MSAATAEKSYQSEFDRGRPVPRVRLEAAIKRSGITREREQLGVYGAGACVCECGGREVVG